MSQGTTVAAWGSLDPEDRASLPSLAEIWDRDVIQPPAVLYVRPPASDYGSEPIDKRRFVDPAFHRLEVEHLWKRVWQWACREQTIPNVGDYTTYDIADQSVFIVREAPDRIRAYHNVCLHRGNRLVDGTGTIGPNGTFQCSFHGWTWNQDGSLARVPCRWDFPEVRDTDYGLRPVQVDTWDGWVFINLDRDAEPLSSFLAPEIVEQFKLWPHADRFTAAHVGRVLPTNWKAAMEAFLETWHVYKVHPQALPGGIDCGAQYDQYGFHARMIEATGIPSPHLAPGAYTDQDVVDSMIGGGTTAGFSDKLQTTRIAEGSTARAFIADWNREQLSVASGRDFSEVSDAEMMDVIEYFIFPNFIPWGGFSFPIVYRFRPYGDDGQKCFMETLLMAPFSGERPPDAQLHVLPEGSRWTEAPELGGMGPILDQDDVNVMKIQRGLRSDAITHLAYSTYQESNIRALHRGIDHYVSQP